MNKKLLIAQIFVNPVTVIAKVADVLLVRIQQSAWNVMVLISFYRKMCHIYMDIVWDQQFVRKVKLFI